MKASANFFALLAMLAMLSTFPAASRAQAGGWTVPKGEVAFSQNQFPELKGLTYSQEDQAKAANLCSQHGGGAESRLCMLAAKYYMQEGQQEVDAQRQQEPSSVQASAQAGQSQQSGESSVSLVEAQESVSAPSASMSAQSAVEPISDDDLVDMLAKALVTSANNPAFIFTVCGANSDVPQCHERLFALDNEHFPFNTGESIASNVGSQVLGKSLPFGSGSRENEKKRVCELRFTNSYTEVMFRQWGSILQGDEGQWEAGTTDARSKLNPPRSVCSSDQVAYFNKISEAALERAENVVSKAHAQVGSQKAALEKCQESAPYIRHLASAWIVNAPIHIRDGEAEIQQLKQMHPNTVKDMDQINSRIAKISDGIEIEKSMYAKSVDDYRNAGGNENDKKQVSVDASSVNPCAALGDPAP